MEERYDKSRQIDVTRIGKKLAYLRRHSPDFVDDNGWADVLDMLKELKVDKKDFKRIIPWLLDREGFYTFGQAAITTGDYS